jgi:uncharacterized OsmC-like protein
LASCVALYVHRYCVGHGLDARGVAVEVTPVWRPDPGRFARFDVLLHVPATFSGQMAAELGAVAAACPVHNTLSNGAAIVVGVVVAGAARDADRFQGVLAGV